MCVGFVCFCYSTSSDQPLRKISLPSTWILHFWFIKLKRDSAASCPAVVWGGTSFFFHTGSCCGQTHHSQEHYRTKDAEALAFWRQQTWLVFRLWVLWNVYLCIWYVQNQPSSARSFRLVWQLGTPIILFPDHIHSRQRGLLVSCDSTWILAYLVSLLFLKGVIQALCKVPSCIVIKQAMLNMIERRRKKREEKNGMKNPRGTIPSVLRHQSFQHL